MAKFSKQQIEVLSAYERYFETAVRAAWASYPGQAGLQTIYDVFTTATGDQRHLKTSCGTCVLNLLRDCGTQYFKDKQEYIDQENDAKAAELTIQEVKPKRKYTKRNAV